MPEVCLDQVLGPAWVQDLGRPGAMHMGVPWGGALVPELLMAANVVLGNPPEAAGIEFFGQLRLSLPPGWGYAVDGQAQVATAEPMTVRVTPGQRVSYLCVAGGLQVEPVLGGRGTLLVAGLGGWQGRALAHGDVIPLGEPAELPAADQGRIKLPRADDPIWIRPGPDRALCGDAAWCGLLEQVWSIDAAGDRSGTRLCGEPLRVDGRAQSESQPMVRGGIQLPPSGLPIVLGPDHPVTGGYPLIAVVHQQSLGSLQMRQPNTPVQLMPLPEKAA